MNAYGMKARRPRMKAYRLKARIPMQAQDEGLGWRIEGQKFQTEDESLG